MNNEFSIRAIITITQENKRQVKNLIKSLEAINAIDEPTASVAIAEAECLDYMEKGNL